jgi:hypothetical protein
MLIKHHFGCSNEEKYFGIIEWFLTVDLVYLIPPIILLLQLIDTSTVRKSGLDGCMRVHIRFCHPIQTQVHVTKCIADQFKLGCQTPGLLSLNQSAIHLVACT